MRSLAASFRFGLIESFLLQVDRDPHLAPEKLEAVSLSENWSSKVDEKETWLGLSQLCPVGACVVAMSSTMTIEASQNKRLQKFLGGELRCQR